MTFSTENFLFLDAVLVLASIVISKWGYRFGIPTLLLFLYTGMLFGTDGLGLEFNSHEDAQFIGMLSLALQGTTITTAARWLGLATEEEKDSNDFGIELPDELESKPTELTLTKEQLAGGSRLQDLQFPKGTLVMMVKREGSFIVPNGQMEMRAGDILLTITHQGAQKNVS